MSIFTLSWVTRWNLSIEKDLLCLHDAQVKRAANPTGAILMRKFSHFYSTRLNAKNKKKCMPFFMQRILLLVTLDALMSFWPLFQFHRLFLMAAYEPPFGYHTVTIWTLNYGTFVKYYKRLSIVIVLNCSCSRLLFFPEENSDSIKNGIYQNRRNACPLSLSFACITLFLSLAHITLSLSFAYIILSRSLAHMIIVVILLLKFHSVNKL